MKTLVLGAAIVDIIMKIPKLPKSGEDVLCTERKLTVGGCAYNVANIFLSIIALKLSHTGFLTGSEEFETAASISFISLSFIIPFSKVL